MTWDYRVVAKRHEQTGDLLYGIHEVFLDEEDRAWTCTEEPVLPMGESLEGLRDEFLMMASALINLNPVVDYDLIPQEGAESPIAECFDEEGELTGSTIPLAEVMDEWLVNHAESNCNCGHCIHWRGAVSGRCLGRPLSVRDVGFEVQQRYITTDATDWCSLFEEEK